MLPFTWFCFLLVTTSSAIASIASRRSHQDPRISDLDMTGLSAFDDELIVDQELQNKVTDIDYNHDNAYRGKERRKRSLVAIGKAAFKALFKDAKFVGYNANKVGVYEKSGGFERAQKDFKTLVPQYIAMETGPGRSVLHGELEGRVFTLYQGDELLPTILHIGKKGPNKVLAEDEVILYKYVNMKNLH